MVDILDQNLALQGKLQNRPQEIGYQEKNYSLSDIFFAGIVGVAAGAFGVSYVNKKTSFEK